MQQPCYEKMVERGGRIQKMKENENDGEREREMKIKDK
jgi:hypothetical protein